MKIKLLTLYFICLFCNLLTAQTVQWSVKPTYSSLEEYVGKLYKYRENGKIGLVDISGKVLVEARYDSITPFIDYHALALDFQGGKYMLKGIIDQNNFKMIEVSDGYSLSKKYPYFSEGKLVVSSNNGKYGYMLTDGSLLVECQYEEAFPYYQNRALVYKIKGKNEIYLTEYGEQLIPELIRIRGPFSRCYESFNEKGFSLVYCNYKWRIINLNGKEIESFAFDEKEKAKAKCPERKHEPIHTDNFLSIPMESDVLSVKDDRGLFGFQIKGKDDWCVPSQFSEAFSFKEGYARVKKDGKYGVLKLISDVSFDGSLLQSRMKVIHGKSDSLKYTLNLPQQLGKVGWKLDAEDVLGSSQPYVANNVKDGIQIAFKPHLRNKESEKSYKFSLSLDEILLWEDFETVEFEYLYPINVSFDVPIVNKDKHECFSNGYYGLDQDNQLIVYSELTNNSSEDVEIQVKVWAKYKNTSENLKTIPEVSGKIILKANSVKKFKAIIGNVEREGELEVFVQLLNIGVKQNIIKVKPLK